jgi:hypothetical protein
MEMFLMAAISRGGLKTLYAFQRAAGLQPGSLAPVINSLIGAGLLTRSEGGKRGRRPMELTESGERVLIHEWKNSLDAYREVESILRSVTVALWMGDLATALSILFESAVDRTRRQGPQRLEDIRPGMTLNDLHTEMRTVVENRRRAMEASLLDEFGHTLVAAGPHNLVRSREIR